MHHIDVKLESKIQGVAYASHRALICLSQGTDKSHTHTYTLILCLTRQCASSECMETGDIAAAAGSGMAMTHDFYVDLVEYCRN